MLCYVIAFFEPGRGLQLGSFTDGSFDFRDLNRDVQSERRDVTVLAGSRVSLTQPPVGHVHQQFNNRNNLISKYERRCMVNTGRVLSICAIK